MEDYCFFFSYTSEDYRNSKRSNVGVNKDFYLIDCFFDQLARVVSGKIGMAQDKAAFRDSRRLELGDVWSNELTNALQASRTLIALVSPCYLKSENCGREIQFFLDRYKKLSEENPGNVFPHRILPIYWESSAHCHRNIPETAQQFLAATQLKTGNFPETYPATGLRSFICNSQPEPLEKICDAVADRIVQFYDENSLPLHPDPKPFTELPSLFKPSTNHCLRNPAVTAGTGTAQVVYVVGKADELAASGHTELSCYSCNSEGWKPFPDAPGATIEAATQEGIRMLEGMGCCNWGWPDTLVEKIREAEQKKSPVLLVLDRNSLRVDRLSKAMGDYDKVNFNNAGLITAGGAQFAENNVSRVFEHKFYNPQETHLWTIPAGRTDFVQKVATVVGHIKRKLVTLQAPMAPPSPLPSLRGPCGN